MLTQSINKTTTTTKCSWKAEILDLFSHSCYLCHFVLPRGQRPEERGRTIWKTEAGIQGRLPFTKASARSIYLVPTFYLYCLWGTWVTPLTSVTIQKLKMFYYSFEQRVHSEPTASFLSWMLTEKAIQQNLGNTSL